MRQFGIVGLLLALGACTTPEGAQSAGALAELTDGAECVAQANGEEQVYRWRAGQLRLELTKPAATMRGLRLSTFVYQLDDKDLLLSKEQQVGSVAEWRHVYTRDNHGNPLTFVYESQGSVASTQFYTNSYQGDRLMKVEQSTSPGTPVTTLYTYEYDDKGRRNYERIELPQLGQRKLQEIGPPSTTTDDSESVRRSTCTAKMASAPIPTTTPIGWWEVSLTVAPTWEARTATLT